MCTDVCVCVEDGGGLNPAEMQVEAVIMENPHKPCWSGFSSHLHI